MESNQKSYIQKRIRKKSLKPIYCVFGFNKHEPNTSVLSNRGATGIPRPFELDSFSTLFTKLSICNKCEKRLKKIYMEYINIDKNWKGDFTTFAVVCMGERLKYLASGMCVCENDENENNNNNNYVSKKFHSNADHYLTNVLNRYMW